ncbi:helix-turn-helix domain-containing protein [Actinomadura algeriensis]|uniref:helix-turn-helix domain-containing protein n=1 Tax=Actinomadura algeriensis TaxID=1679523 RepID=UPI00384DB6A5
MGRLPARRPVDPRPARRTRRAFEPDPHPAVHRAARHQPRQWLLGRRLDAARELLEQTDLPVEAIAARVGLVSAGNLRRRFRAHLGTTPGAYRRTFGETR